MLKRCNKIYIDFDGVVVDSNGFKEKAIKETINELFGINKNNQAAIRFFNENAGISRKIKLAKFFNEDKAEKINQFYSEKCFKYFSKVSPANGLIQFLNILKKNHKMIEVNILSGGEKTEIINFLERNQMTKFFDKILCSESSKLEHLKKHKASKADIFIGDSKKDLETAEEIGLNFILFEEFKSEISFPENETNKKIFLELKILILLLSF